MDRPHSVTMSVPSIFVLSAPQSAKRRRKTNSEVKKRRKKGNLGQTNFFSVFKVVCKVFSPPFFQPWCNKVSQGEERRGEEEDEEEEKERAFSKLELSKLKRKNPFCQAEMSSGRKCWAIKWARIL